MATASASRTPEHTGFFRSDPRMVDLHHPAVSAGLWLLALTVLGGLLRVFRLGANSLWVDEYATLKIVSLPFSQILGAAAEVNFCPPLYFWSVHGVISTVGVSEASLRLVSAIAGTLTIPIAGLLTRELTASWKIGVLAAALLALNPLHVWYSQEARAYAFLVWVGSSALLFLVLAQRRNSAGPWLGYVACMAAVLLTHTTGPVFLAVAWAWALFSRSRVAFLARLAVATGLALLIALPFFLHIAAAVAQAQGTHSPPRPLTGLEFPYTIFTYLVGYSFGPSTREIQNLGPLAAIGRHAIEIAIGGAAVAGVVTLMLLRPAPGKKHFLTLSLVPVLAMILASATSGKAYQARYALAGLVGFCGLAAAALSRLPGRFRPPAIAALLTLCVWADGQWYFVPEYRKDDSRALVGWLSERLPEGSTVAVAPRYVIGVLSHYGRLESSSITFAPADSLTGSMRPEALVFTRLHHVMDVSAIRDQFRRLIGPNVREDSVGGYWILRRTAEQAAALGSRR